MILLWPWTSLAAVLILSALFRGTIRDAEPRSPVRPARSRKSRFDVGSLFVHTDYIIQSG